MPEQSRPVQNNQVRHRSWDVPARPKSSDNLTYQRAAQPHRQSFGFLPPNISWGKLDEIKKQNIGLSNEVRTVAEILKAGGYATAAISANPWIGPDFNFVRGFDNFRHIPRGVAGELSKTAIAQLERLDLKQPFFLYLHYLDPHEPYTPPEKYKELFSGPLKQSASSYDEKTLQDIGLYDGEIRYMDTALGKFFDFLKAQGVYERALIVVLSDHGEQFGEHGNTGHGHQLFNEEVHVPLFIKPPGKEGWEPRVVTDVVSTIDVAPTVLSFAGQKSAPGMQSVVLAGSESRPQRSGVFSEIKRKYNQRAYTSLDQKKLIIGSFKEEDGNESDNPATNVVGLFDLNTDWYEQKPLSDASLLEGLQEDFSVTLSDARALAVKPDTAGKGGISEETMKQLESLGYMK